MHIYIYIYILLLTYIYIYIYIYTCIDIIKQRQQQTTRGLPAHVGAPGAARRPRRIHRNITTKQEKHIYIYIFIYDCCVLYTIYYILSTIHCDILQSSAPPQPVVSNQQSVAGSQQFGSQQQSHYQQHWQYDYYYHQQYHFYQQYFQGSAVQYIIL